MKRIYRLALILCLVLLAACGVEEAPAAPEAASRVPVGSCSLDLAAASDEEQIRAVLNGEGANVVAQDIVALMALWAEEAQVVDAKNTPDDATDDQVWTDKIAIEHRYVRTVFPGAPAVAQPADLDISISGETATVRATTQIGDEVSPGGDRWDLVKQDGCWLIKQLTYNLEPNQ